MLQGAAGMPASLLLQGAVLLSSGFSLFETTAIPVASHCPVMFCLAPRLVVAACYRELGEKMKLLWTKHLQMNTVHVSDVVRASWHVATLDSQPSGTIYNLADKAETSKDRIASLCHGKVSSHFAAQGLITELVSSIFHIESGYFGTILSNLAKVSGWAAGTPLNNGHTLTPAVCREVVL